MDWRECPDCGVELRPPRATCPRCLLPLDGPLAGELARLTADINELDARRARLVERREEVLGRLRAMRPPRRGRRLRPAPIVLGALSALTATAAAMVITDGVRGLGDAALTSGLLVVAALLASAWAYLLRGGPKAVTTTVAAMAGATAVAAVAVPFAVMPWAEGWGVGACAVAGCVVFAFAGRLPAFLRPGMALAVAAVLAVTCALVIPDIPPAVLTPLGWVTEPWQGAPDLPGGTVSVPVVMAAIAFVFLHGDRLVRKILADLSVTAEPSLVWMRVTAHAFTALAVASFPAATGLPYPIVLILLYGMAVALLVLGGLVQVRTLAEHRTVVALGTGVAVLLAAWSLAERMATLPTLVAIFVLFGFCALLARTAAAQIVNGAGAVLAAGGVAAAIPLTFDWPFLLGAAGLLGVRAVTLAKIKLPHRVRLASARIHAPLPAVPAARTGQWVALEVSAMVVSYGALAGGTPDTIAVIMTLIALLAAFGSRSRRGRWRLVALGESYLLAAVAPLVLAGSLLPVLFGPYGWLTSPWSGAPEAARAALTPWGAWQARPVLLPVLILAALAAGAAARLHKGRRAGLVVAFPPLVAAAVTLPPVVGLPYWGALAYLVALTAWLATRRPGAMRVLALWTGSLTGAWSLAEPVATCTVLPALALIVLLRRRGPRRPPRPAVARETAQVG